MITAITLFLRHLLSHYKSYSLHLPHLALHSRTSNGTMIKLKNSVIGFVIFALLFESSLQQGDSIIQSSEGKIIRAWKNNWFSSLSVHIHRCSRLFNRHQPTCLGASSASHWSEHTSIHSDIRHQREYQFSRQSEYPAGLHRCGKFFNRSWTGRSWKDGNVCVWSNVPRRWHQLQFQSVYMLKRSFNFALLTPMLTKINIYSGRWVCSELLDFAWEAEL